MLETTRNMQKSSASVLQNAPLVRKQGVFFFDAHPQQKIVTRMVF